MDDTTTHDDSAIMPNEDTGQEVASQEPAPTTPETGTNPTTEGQEPNPVGEVDDPRVKKANGEAARYRTQLREQEAAVAEMQAKYDALLAGLGKLSGHVPEEGQQVDPEDAIRAATERAENAETAARTLQVSTDLRDQADSAGLNPRLLIPLLKGEGKLSDLDPTSEDYATQVEALITEAKDAYPELRTQVVPRSSGNAPTPTEGEKQITRDDLQKMSAAEINQAVKAGKLAHLMNPKK